MKTHIIQNPVGLFESTSGSNPTEMPRRLTSQRLLGGTGIARVRGNPRAARPTPFGLPVLPDVYRRKSSSSAPRPGTIPDTLCGGWIRVASGIKDGEPLPLQKNNAALCLKKTPLHCDKQRREKKSTTFRPITGTHSQL